MLSPSIALCSGRDRLASVAAACCARISKRASRAVSSFRFSRLVDLLLFTRQHVARSDLADGTVKATIVVITDELREDSLCILTRHRALRSDTIALESLVIAFKLSIALGIVKACTHVSLCNLQLPLL